MKFSLKISKTDLIDKYLIISIIAVYLLVPALFESISIYQLISFEIWLGLILSTIISIFMIYSKYTERLNFEKIKYKKKIFTTSSLYFILLIIFLWEALELINIIKQFDPSVVRQDLFYKESTTEVINSRNLNSFIRLFFASFILILYNEVLHNERKEKKKLMLFLLIIIVFQALQILFISNHRSPIITFIIFLIFVYHFYIREIKINVKIAIFILIFLTIIFYWLSWSAYYRAGIIAEFDEVNLVHGMRGLSTALEIESIKQAIKDGELKYEYGLQMIYNFIIWVPRIIWESKPFVSFSFRITELIYGVPFVETWVRTYTIPGEGYLQFGFIGMILWSIAFVYMYRLSKKIIIKFPMILPFFLQVWSAFPVIVRGDLSTYFARFFSVIITFFVIYFFLKLLANLIPKYKDQQL